MRKLTLLGLSLLALNAYANLNIPGLSAKSLSQSGVSDNALSNRGLQTYEDDVLDSQNIKDMKLSEKELHQARVWGLNEDEERRYLALMQNKSGVYYEGLHLTPVDILGLNARTEAEREHFATLSARFEAQKVAQNLAWDSAYHKAYNALFKNIPVVDLTFDPSPFGPLAHKPVALQPKDELYLFVKPSDAVKSILSTLSDAVSRQAGARLHLMILDASDEDVQFFANRMGLSHDQVANGVISLSHGELQYEGLSLKHKNTPLLLLSRNNASSVVDLGRI